MPRPIAQAAGVGQPEIDARMRVRRKRVLTEETQHDARATLSEGLSQALARSEGFDVESPIGVLGVVEAVRMSGQPRRPVALVVRVGVPDGETTVLVPVSSIEDVAPETHRILLRPGILLRRSGEHTRARRGVVSDG